VPSSDLILAPPAAGAIDELVDLMNHAFSDYIVPIVLSSAAFRGLLARDNVDLAASYVARRGDQAVGLALTALRRDAAGVRSRVAGMGVTPEGRGQGVARALLARQLGDARARGSRMLILECFTTNSRALPLYKHAGFVARRRLLGYRAEAAPLRAAPGREVTLQPADPAGLPALAQRCAEADLPWQLEGVTLAGVSAGTPAYTIQAAGDPEPGGYVVFGAAAGAPEVRLAHIGVLPAQRRRGLATAALRRWLILHPEIATLTIPPLVPEEMDGLRAWLAACGFRPSPLAQWEMAAPLLAQP